MRNFKNYFKDLSLSVLTAMALIFPTVIFTVISISEHRWFWPKFVQFGGNGTENLFKQIFDSYRNAREAISSHRRGYYYSGYYNDWSSYREFSIKVHLITDPLNAVITEKVENLYSFFHSDFLNARHSSQRGPCCLFGEDDASLESVGTKVGGLQESASKLHRIGAEIFKALAAQRHSMGELRKMQNVKKNKN